MAIAATSIVTPVAEGGAFNHITDAFTSTSGSTLVVFAGTYGTSFGATPISDSKSNTWVEASVATDVAGSGQVGLWYNTNGTRGTSHTITVATSTSFYCTLFVVEVTGGLTENIVDQVVTWIEDDSSPYAISTGATAAGNQIALFGWINTEGGTTTPTYSDSFSSLASVTDGSQYVCGGVAAKSFTGTGAVSQSLTLSNSPVNVGLVMLTLKEEASTQSNAPRAAAYYRMMRNR